MKAFSIYIIFFLQIFYSFTATALTGFYSLHDPSSIIKDHNKYYIFSSGRNIKVTISSDLFRWSSGKDIFITAPDWIKKIVPNWGGDYWAPECVYMQGKYYLYYSCSSWGSSVSVIGLATNITLDTSNSNYQWTDQGMVVSSSSDKDFNAIDPSIFKKDNEDIYLTYGSYFNGIAIVKLDPITGKPVESIMKIAGGYGKDYEASYLFKNKKYYYLVINRGYCCNGLKSTYFMIIGRSKNPTGPFVDDNNIDMNNGGGKLLLSSSSKYIGPGHFGLFKEKGINYVSMHYYDAEDKGLPKLDIATLQFIQGWPSIKRNLNSP